MGECTRQKNIFTDCEEMRKRRRIDASGSHHHGSVTKDDTYVGEEVDEDNQPKTVDDLFDELLQNIFSYVHAEEVLDILSKVCVRWERIANDPTTLSQTQLILDGTNEDAIINTLKIAPCLDTVFILSGVSDNVFDHLTEGPRVQGLVFAVETAPISVHRVVSLLAHNQDTLRRLSLRVNSELVNSRDFQHILGGMRRLTYLHLASESFVSCDETCEMDSAPPLRTLRMEQFIYDNTKPFVGKLLKGCRDTLKSLNLSPETDSSLLETGTFQGSQIEKLQVTFQSLQIITELPSLTSLCVVGFRHPSPCSWISIMPVAPRVTTLSLQSVYEPSNVQNFLIKCLICKFNHLRIFLGMEGSLQNDTFKLMLKSNRTLEEIHLFDFSGFDDIELVKILETYSPNIKYIDVSMTHIPDAVITALRDLATRVPRLTVSYPVTEWD